MTKTIHQSKKSPRDRSASAWARRYGKKHKPVRVSPPEGIEPGKVRVYRRNDHYLLQWWDQARGRTQSERVDGDLLDAFARAREVDGNLQSLGRGGGKAVVKITHGDLVGRYLMALEQLADDGELALSTARRYSGALKHYTVYTDRHANHGNTRYATRTGADFTRGFMAYLRSPDVKADTDYILSVARAMYLWAADPARGGLLPLAFVNPFLGKTTKKLRRRRRSLLEAPAITASMAAELTRACDAYQIRLFAPVVFFGLRPSELCLLTYEDLEDGFLNVYCFEELDHTTKGNADKRLPLPPLVENLLDPAPDSRRGLLIQRRAVAEDREVPACVGLDRAGLVRRYKKLLSSEKNLTAKTRETLRKAVVRDAGGVTYKQIYSEFNKLISQLGWTGKVTLKDLRHLFASFTHDGGMPEAYRKFLMGHAPGGEAIVTYTHLDKVREHYDRAVQREFAEVLEALEQRMGTSLTYAA